MAAVNSTGTQFQRPGYGGDAREKLWELLSVGNSLRILFTKARPRRLIQEDPGIEGPLWFGQKPDDAFHVHANCLRLFIAIVLAPVYVFIPHTERSFSKLVRFVLWGTEWTQVPDAVLSHSPKRSSDGAAKAHGQYAVSGSKPQWLLEVYFRGDEIVSVRQVRYGEGDTTSSPKIDSTSEPQALRKSIQQHGYVAISYAMQSAEALFKETGKSLDPQPEIDPGPGKRAYSLQNRKNIVRALLDEYGRARAMAGKQDGYEFIWLDEFCLSDDSKAGSEEDSQRDRDIEIGQLADIFRGAENVVVFCHIIGCDHTGVTCPWGNRLFTLGEILHTPQVLQMTREGGGGVGGSKKAMSNITQIPGQTFRADMQAKASAAKMWHLYNIMQHATNSGTVTWQSAIHSLVVEAIRRDEANQFLSHHFLGKALNGLLPRRAQLEDLKGQNGWADLAWLLELNQGYYNAAMLAAVCKLAHNDVKEYRWWGKPVPPREGCERLEPLVTAIPVRFRDKRAGTSEPVLSIVGPKCVRLSHMLKRDSGGLYHNENMRGLGSWVLIIWTASVFVGPLLFPISFTAGLVLMECMTVVRVIIELLAGTIYVVKDSWVVFEQVQDPRDLVRYLASQDASIDDLEDWGEQQLVPEWESRDGDRGAHGEGKQNTYQIVLADLRTGTLVQARVASRPNDMVVLAVHGIGITCMLLHRDEKVKAASVASKVGMANLPPFVLAQGTTSGTIYVGDRIPPVPKVIPQLFAPVGETGISGDLEKGHGSGSTLVLRRPAGVISEKSFQSNSTSLVPPLSTQIASPSLAFAGSLQPALSSTSFSHPGGSGLTVDRAPSYVPQSDFNPYQDVGN